MQFDVIGNKESSSRFSKWLRHHTSFTLLTRYGVHPAFVVPVLEYFIIDGRLTTPAAIVVDHDVVITVRHAVTVAVPAILLHVSGHSSAGAVIVPRTALVRFFSLRIVVSQYVSARIGPVNVRNGKWTAIAPRTGSISGAFVGGLAQAAETGRVEIRHESR